MEPIKQIKSVAQTYSEMIEGYKSKPDSKKPSKEKKLDEMRVNVTKPPENPVIKQPIITQGLPNMDDAGAIRLQRKTGIDLGASPGPEGVPLGNPKATAAVEANRRRQFLKNTKSSVNQELPVSHPVSHPEITSPPKHESNSESRQHPKPRRSNR